MTDLLTQTPLRRGLDAILLLIRLLVAGFLIVSAAPYCFQAAKLTEFVALMTKYGFAAPHILAPLSVWVMFLASLCLIAGLATGWAGLVVAFNFVVAIVMVDRFQGISGSFPSASLIAMGLLLAAAGPGRYALDTWIARRA
ncbi:DoxX family protein [Phenylobacterium sp.]|uniref:DoxX family protein n=1 Tax=Phenylobacterium sp. TaxID=1871053 RepID=UPI0027372CBB|nr:DoxX family protein [Phenylobacterium sp.]MDP3853365.1 DoxX family protein [Phenylobacterium sp.]